ncbi:hypothetical protein BIWAKO_00051 [Bosea sp. BIWAKO-01]|nr:hypothetical protein BIWAKO_00051 [Bosea sp. BIWAKO-01]
MVEPAIAWRGARCMRGLVARAEIKAASIAHRNEGVAPVILANSGRSAILIR